MKRKAYSRAERKEMILNEFYKSLGAHSSVWMSAYGMAKALGLNSAQHVRNILNEMVKEGTLTVIQISHRPNRDKLLYAPSPMIPIATDEQVRTRHIAINGMAYRFD